ncbi:hypothetical protein JXA56_00020 [Candidatus Micrarchaeota archaeon]|nr:hypothetical protein [Candidatus Micrarchaeota archaeon]
MRGILFALLMISISFASTTCNVDGCDITITLKIAFSGADDAYIQNAKNEIESVWNGPGGSRTIGDCKCTMKFEVITNKTADCKNNPPQDWHCIMVTDYNNEPPRNQTNWTGAEFYIGYMYNISTGNGNNSVKGWWSNIMSRPVDANDPQGEHYKDFAHEAGHMMGLEDGDGGIMSRTFGANSGPTQANLEEIANDICGANACPDRCCCGNGQIDSNIGEKCDPFARPAGCGAGESCCPVCCSCFAPICIPANGEFLEQSECWNRCGSDSTCYKNYKTGCWDCVKQQTVITGTCRDPENVRGNADCDHELFEFGEYTAELSVMFGNERMNIVTAEGDTGNIITENNKVKEVGTELLEDPTVMITTDRETVSLIAGEYMSIQQGIATGRIKINGQGILNGFKFFVYEVVFGMFNFFSPAPEAAIPVVDRNLPEEYMLIAQPEPDLPEDDPERYDILGLPDSGRKQHG